MTEHEALYGKIEKKLQEVLQQGLKKTAIANGAGIRHQQFARVERALKQKRGLSSETLEKLCKYLDI